MTHLRKIAGLALLWALAAGCSPVDQPPTADTVSGASADQAAGDPDVPGQADAASPGNGDSGGSAAQLSPKVLDFAQVKTGECKVKTAALANWGATPLSVHGWDLAALDPQFEFQWLAPAALAGQSSPGGAKWLLGAPLVLQPGQSAGVSVRFCPTKPGPAAAEAALLSDGGPAALGLQASAVGAELPCLKLRINGKDPQLPAAGQLGAAVVGQTVKGTLSVENCGAAKLAMTKLTLLPDGAAGAEKFSLNLAPLVAAGKVGPGAISDANPLVIPPLAAVSIGLAYSPLAVTPPGQFDAAKLEVGFSHGAAASIALSGVGLAPQCPVAVVQIAEGSLAEPQTTLHLNGLASYSPAGLAIKKYLWTVKQPAGANQPLVPNPAFAAPTFQANTAGEYEFCLDVWDELGTKSCKPACASLMTIPSTAIHIELLWSTPNDPNESDSGPAAGADLDLHFAHPLASNADRDCDGAGDPWFSNPFDVFWFTPNPDWGAIDQVDDDPSLDLDDTDGAGPENLNLAAPEGAAGEPVAYSVGVHYWNDYGLGTSVATVQIYLSGVLVAKFASKLKPLDMWYVGKLHWPYMASAAGKKSFEACYQAGDSCQAGAKLSWVPKGDACVTKCYLDPSFMAMVGGVAAGACP